MSALSVEWRDAGREPQCAPNAAYPEGIDVDGSLGAPITCETALPYPAPRCGLYIVRCPICDASVGVTTAGRPDDPRSDKIACKGMARA